MKRLMIVHNGCDGVRFVRLEDSHWGLDRVIGQPSWSYPHSAPSWSLVDVPDANCFVKEEFRDEFLGSSSIDPRYTRSEMVLVSHFTRS